MIAVAVAASSFVQWRQRHRGLEVRFEDDRILFGDLDGRITVEAAWADLESFDDRDAEAIEVHASKAASHKVPGRLIVPTPTEEGRAAALALLDARGLRRLEE